VAVLRKQRANQRDGDTLLGRERCTVEPREPFLEYTHVARHTTQQILRCAGVELQTALAGTLRDERGETCVAQRCDAVDDMCPGT
jgi:hypothetical protein